jgi:AcrR family transcriptional regulator
VPTAVPDDGAGVRTASRHEILLTEAIRLFHRLGYHAVGVDDIGTAAGINASSVYRYFPSKADLLAAAYYRASERLAAMTESALNGATDAPEALRRLVDSYVTFSFEQSDLVSVYVSENNNLPHHDRHQLRRTQRLHVEEWVRLLTTARPGLPAVEARLLVHAALNLVSDLGRAVRFARGAGTEALVTTLAGVGLNA